MAEDRWLWAWALTSVSLGGASLLVPLYVVVLGGGPVELGILASSAAFVGVPGALAGGKFAEKPATRRPLVVGSFVAIAATLTVVPFLDAIVAVLLANAVVWLAFAAVVPVLTLLVTVGVPEADWQARFATFNRFQGYGWAGGLVAGMAWTEGVGLLVGPATTQRTFFGVVAACAAVSAVLAVRWLPTTGGRRALASPRTVARALTRASRLNVRGATMPFAPARLYWTTRALSPRRLRSVFPASLSLYFGAVVVFFTGFAVFFAPLPAFLAGVGYGSSEIFALYLASSLGAAAFFLTAGRLATRYDVVSVHAVGLVVRAAALPGVAVVGLSLAASPAGLASSVAVFLLVGVTWAVIAVTATTLVTRLAPPTIRGEVLGIYTALAALAGGVGALVGGWLATVGYLVAFGAAGGLVFLGAVLVVTAGRVAGRPTRQTTDS